jgi:CubicO group peptidase (beta-lactamase class C family)
MSATEVPGRAVGYMDGPGGLVRNDPTLPFRGTPAGGGYSTVGDLVRFADALASGKLLDAERMQLITTGGAEIATDERYGAGFAKSSRGGARWHGHGGGAPGMNGTLLVFAGAGYVVAALSNGDPPQASSLGEFIGQRLPVS